MIHKRLRDNDLQVDQDVTAIFYRLLESAAAAHLMLSLTQVVSGGNQMGALSTTGLERNVAARVRWKELGEPCLWSICELILCRDFGLLEVRTNQGETKSVSVCT